MALQTADNRTQATIVAVGVLLFAAAAVLAGCNLSERQPAPLGAAAPSGAAVQLQPDAGFFFNQDEDTASLAYGRANSDDVDLMLQCQRGSRRIDITDVARETLKAGAVPLTLASGDARSDLKAEVGPDETGLTLAVAHASPDLPALAGFRKSGLISVKLGARQRLFSASASERAGVARFFAACERK